MVQRNNRHIFLGVFEFRGHYYNVVNVRLDCAGFGCSYVNIPEDEFSFWHVWYKSANDAYDAGVRFIANGIDSYRTASTTKDDRWLMNKFFNVDKKDVPLCILITIV